MTVLLGPPLGLTLGDAMTGLQAAPLLDLKAQRQAAGIRIPGARSSRTRLAGMLAAILCQLPV